MALSLGKKKTPKQTNNAAFAPMHSGGSQHDQDVQCNRL